MDAEDPGMWDMHDDDEELFALLDEQRPDSEPINRRASFSKKKLTFSSPVRPSQSCLVELNYNPNGKASVSVTDSGEHTENMHALLSAPLCPVQRDVENGNPNASGANLKQNDLQEPRSCLVEMGFRRGPAKTSHARKDKDFHDSVSGQSCSLQLNNIHGQPIVESDYSGEATEVEPGLSGISQSKHVSENGRGTTLFRPTIPDIDLTSHLQQQGTVEDVGLYSDKQRDQRAVSKRNRFSVQSAPAFYKMFNDDSDDCRTINRTLLALKRMPAHMNFLTITSAPGGNERRLYLTRSSLDHYTARMQNLTRQWQRNMKRTQLLNESIEILLERIEKKKIERLVQDEEASLALAEKMMLDDLDSTSKPFSGSKKRCLESENETGRDMSGSLFVDRFAPKTFLALLSDSRINREVMQWVQAWDPSVFHYPPRARPKPSSESLSKSNRSPFNSRNQDSSSNKRARPAPWLPRNPGFERGPDQRPDDHRPYPRALLFAGPPGSGKTTLAHCIASQAGYNIIEINASDDRSTSTLRSKIIRAVSMESMFADRKPNLVVVDEIDGVDDPAAIRALIEIITDNAVIDTRKQSSKKKGNATMLLQRPIICICNDLYAKALRPLREVVLTYMFSVPTSSALQQRVSHICSQVGLEMESSAFRYICDQSRNDIRSTLQTLQFVVANAHINRRFKVHRQDVQSLISDHKDLAIDHFSLWRAVFHKETKFNEIIDLIASCKDSDKITDGMFEFYPNMPYSDPDMSKTFSIADCFSYTDALSATSSRRQIFSMMAYSTLIAATIHLYCSVRHVPKILPPKQAFHHSRNLIDSRDILFRFSSQLRRRSSEQATVTELIPALYHIITPKALQSESTMMSIQDEKIMMRITGIMLRYGLSFTTVSDTVKGQLRFTLQPDISKFCQYSSAEGSSFLIRLPRIWIERITQALTMGPSCPLLNGSTAAPTPDVEQIKGWQGSFKQQKDKSDCQPVLPLVRFRFNEGFTQAVRRPVQIRALFST